MPRLLRARIIGQNGSRGSQRSHGPDEFTFRRNRLWLSALPLFPFPPRPRRSTDPLKFFEGRTESIGTVKIAMKKPFRSRAIGKGEIRSDGTLDLVQRVEDEGEQPRERRWRMRQVGPGPLFRHHVGGEGPGDRRGSRWPLPIPLPHGRQRRRRAMVDAHAATAARASERRHHPQIWDQGRRLRCRHSQARLSGSGRDLLQRVPDGVQRFLSLRAVRPAALGHVGTAAAALPAQRRHRGLDQRRRRLTWPARSSVTPTATLPRPSLTATRAATPEPTRCFSASISLRRLLGSSPSTTWPRKARPPTCSGPAASALAPPPPMASAFFASASSRSRRLRSSTRAATRAGTSSGAALRLAAVSRSLASRCSSHSRAASPVSASIRRTPEETALSEMIFSSWMSPVAATWVPPHSSTE